MGKTYRVKSIFGPTLQGEGTHAGRVVNFLRLAGCNKWTGLEKDREASTCRFCDTDFRGGSPMTALEISHRLLKQSSSRVVVISGGEPSLQIDDALLSLLKSDGFEIHLETNGSRALGTLHTKIDHITMSPKQPLSETLLEECHDLKILYPSILPEITAEKFASFPHRRLYLQPVWDDHYKEHLKATICRVLANPEWRLSLQTHKIVGVE